MTSTTETPSAGAAFDRSASTYDDVFENNSITSAIRPIIWRSLLSHYKPGDHVLELNCGTGTDAIHLAQSGIRVTATDSSAGMLAQAEEKSRLSNVSHLIEFREVSFEKLDALSAVTFDGAFSNFGGLNCTTQPVPVIQTLSQLLKPTASLILCLINKVSLWEIGSFLLRGKPHSAFRRMQKPPVKVRVADKSIMIRYYTPGEFVALISPWFTVEKIFGLNILSPSPNSLRFAQGHPRITATLLSLDDRIRSSAPWRSLGDHFVIEARRKS